MSVDAGLSLLLLLIVGGGGAIGWWSHRRVDQNTKDSLRRLGQATRRTDT